MIQPPADWHSTLAVPATCPGIPQFRLLSESDVHVWLIQQEQTASVVTTLRDELHSDEIIRAEKFARPILQKRYIVRRGILRRLLGAYLGQAAHTLQFCYTESGRPYLPGHALEFNLSHSQSVAIIAISQQSVGIDVEAVQPINDMRLVARHHFTQAEQQSLFALPESAQLDGFYRCWTRKEAVIKLDGRGLGIPLDSFEVTLHPDAPPSVRLLQSPDDVVPSLFALPAPPGYIAALATEQGHRTVYVSCSIG